MPYLVSCFLIVRNEEARLPTCLASIAGLFDETVVIDTGSTDLSREIARGWGARVVQFAWCDSFAAARNEGLRQTEGDWVFYLDADEYLDDINRNKLRHLLKTLGDENSAYLLRIRCRLARDQGSTVLADQVRLFRRHPNHVWRYRVHEQILPALSSTGTSMQETGIAIEHAGYQEPHQARIKLERNLRLLLLDHEAFPRHPYILLYLGWTYLDLGQPAEALPFLERCRALAEPGVTCLPRLYALHVEALRQLGRVDEAVAVCRAGRTCFATDAGLGLHEALLLRQQGDLEQAEGCLRRLLEVYPSTQSYAAAFEGLDGYLSRYHLGQVLLGQGRPVEAEAEWRAALAEQPGFAPAQVELGELLLAQGRWDELDHLVESIGSAGTLETALLEARGLLARGQPGEARTRLEETSRRFPETIGPHVLLTRAFLEEGREDKAEESLRYVLRRDPRQVDCWRNLAKLLRNQNRTRETLDVCLEARQYFPDDPDLLRVQGTSLYELKDWRGASVCLERMLEVQPEISKLSTEERTRRAVVRQTLAYIYDRGGNHERVETQLQALQAEAAEYTGPASCPPAPSS
jgi:tetratricopeptide (TPR) repeat protein